MAKTEGLQLHALLVDTPPELTIENGSMGMHALRQTFETFSYAMAMVDGAPCNIEELLSPIHQFDDHQDGFRDWLKESNHTGSSER